MNRFLSFLLLGAFALTACGGQELGDPLTRNYEIYRGELKSLKGIEVNERITHLFETEEGDILYSFSERYDLDEETGKPVEAYGVINTYANLEKPVFEIRRLSDYDPEMTDEEEVTLQNFQNDSLGFSFTYPSDWTLESSPNSLSLTAPQEEETLEDEDDNTTETSTDTIFIARLEADLTRSVEDSLEDRLSEIRTYVSAQYPELKALTGEARDVGPDGLLSVQYKMEDGSVYYFVPRTEDLFELSYHHETGNQEDRLSNGNTFSSLVSSFRFMPYGAEVPADGSDGSDDSVEDDEDPDFDPEPQDEVSSVEQIEFNKYVELSSTPFQFTMQIPSSFYYQGDSAGYNFDLEDLEELEEGGEGPLLRMDFNASQTEGVRREGDTVSITVQEGNRYYTLNGPLEYEAVMKTMADSIVSTASPVSE